MLSLTKRTEYGLIALIHLYHEDKVCSAREIADQCHIPLPLLMNTMKALQQQGLVTSSRGAKGGYTLASPAEQITLHQIVEALEGPVKLVQCVGDDGQVTDMEMRCELSGCCSLRSPISRVHDKLIELLTAISIKDLAANDSTPVQLAHASGVD